MIDYIPPMIGLPLAAILWTIVILQWRADSIRNRD